MKSLLLCLSLQAGGIKGDLYETVFFYEDTEFGDLNQSKELMKKHTANMVACTVSIRDKKALINLKTTCPLVKEVVEKLVGASKAIKAVSLNPVMPVMARADYEKGQYLSMGVGPGL